MNEYQNSQNEYIQPPIDLNQTPNINNKMYGYLERMKKEYHFTAWFVVSIVEIIFFPLLGILSIVFTNIMKDAFIVGDLYKADKYALYIKIILIIGIALCLLSIIVTIFIWINFINMISNLYSNILSSFPY